MEPAQARCSICPNSTECAKKLELGFVYCRVLRAATFVQIRSEDGGKKPTPVLINYSTVCFFSATSWPAVYKVSYEDWSISCDVNVLNLLYSRLVFHGRKEANIVNWHSLKYLYFFLNFLTGLCYGFWCRILPAGVSSSFEYDHTKKKNQALSNTKIPQYFSQHKNKLLKETFIQHLLCVTPLNCTSHISFWIYRPYGQKGPFATQGFFSGSLPSTSEFWVEQNVGFSGCAPQIPEFTTYLCRVRRR